MHDGAPHRLAGMTDLDPDTGHPTDVGGAWPVGLWRPPTFDLGVRWGPLPPLAVAAVILTAIAVGIRGVQVLGEGVPPEPWAVVLVLAALARTLLYGLAPAVLLMARPTAAARYPVLVFGLLAGCVATTFHAVWDGLVATGMFDAPEQARTLIPDLVVFGATRSTFAADLNVIVGVATQAGFAVATVLVAYGLWIAPGPGRRRTPRPGRAALLGVLLLIYAGPAGWTIVTTPAGVDRGPFDAAFVARVILSAGLTWQAWAVATRLGAGARVGRAWRTAAASIALNVLLGVVSAALFVLSQQRVFLPDPAFSLTQQTVIVLDAVAVGIMTLAFWQGLPGLGQDARAGAMPAEPA